MNQHQIRQRNDGHKGMNGDNDIIHGMATIDDNIHYPYKSN